MLVPPGSPNQAWIRHIYRSPAQSAAFVDVITLTLRLPIRACPSEVVEADYLQGLRDQMILVQHFKRRKYVGLESLIRLMICTRPFLVFHHAICE